MINEIHTSILPVVQTQTPINHINNNNDYCRLILVVYGLIVFFVVGCQHEISVSKMMMTINCDYTKHSTPLIK